MCQMKKRVTVVTVRTLYDYAQSTSENPSKVTKMFRPLAIRCTRMYLNKNNFRQTTNYMTPTTKNHIFLIHRSVVSNRIHTTNFNNYLKSDDLSDVHPPYNEDDLKCATVNRVVSVFQEKLNCTKERATEIYHNYPEINNGKLLDIKRNADLLLENGVTPQSILDDPLILVKDTALLSLNLQILPDLRPKNINDLVPLLLLSTKELAKIKRIVIREEKLVPDENRIYYLSRVMKIEPNIVCKALSKDLRLFKDYFPMLRENITILLRYMDPIDILNSLWIFRLSSNVIKARLIQVKKAKIKKIVPSMIYSEKHLSNIIEKSSKERPLLQGGTVVNYLARRLQFDIATIEVILQRGPRVSNFNVIKIKDICDYLLDEAGYAPIDIARCPKIFSFSLQTTKKRLQEFQDLGSRPPLHYLCHTADNKKLLNRLMNDCERRTKG